jgi:transposase
LSDNNGNIIAPLTTAPVNIHDSELLPDAFDVLEYITKKCQLSLIGSSVTLDSGFYSDANHERIWEAHMMPIIKPNHRNTKDPALIAARDDFFNEYRDVYTSRFTIERCYAWEDKYRKLVTRYERLASTFLGFRLLAYTMINYRTEFKNPSHSSLRSAQG